MSRPTAIRAAAAVVLAGLAIGGYLLWIPVQRPDPQKVAALALTTPVAGLRARPTTSVVALSASTSTSLAAVRAAAASTPGETAAYSVGWKGKAPVTTGSLELIALPTVRSAASAEKEAAKAGVSATSLTSAGYGYGGTTKVDGIPGAKAAYYLKGTKPTITKSTPRATVVVLRAGRVVLDVTVDAKGDAATTTARALALAQYRHLERAGTDTVLAQTLLPLVASVVYVVVALAVIASAEVAPGAVAAARRRRREAHEAEMRRARVARGSKVVKRHASSGYARRVQERAHRR